MASQLDGLFICAAILFVVCQKVEGSESSNCNDLQQVANGALSSGTYSVTNSNGQDFTIYCQFHSEYGYTFVSKNTNVDIDMTSLYDDTTHVIVRHKRSNGNQYTAKMEQLSSHSNVPISVQYNSSTGYSTPQNAAMTPYIFVGFIPANMTYKRAKEGWKCNGQDYKFPNCDANPNSYFVFLFNHGSVSYTSKRSVYNALLFNWYDKSSSVTPSEYLPDEFFTSYYEIHHGGCGGYAQSEAVSDINGVTVGLKFVTKCATPKDIHSGTKSYTGTSVGSTLTYSCDSGLVVLSGDSTRTCNASGGWSGTEPVCGDFDECASNPCQNGATCHNNLYHYTCACATGWQGVNCDIDIDECLPHPCENGGTCIDAINDYTCECLPGYTDKNCSTDIDECRSGPCNNGGTCINAINDYTCECLPGYTDKNCSTNIDECLPHPCENGGTCIDAINDYTCECLPGYTDKNCSTDIDECRSGPCNNGGTCINAINDYTCECLPGYTDKNCSTNIDECLPHPCENGGTCIDAINDYTCECLPGYTDKNCSTDIDECRSGPCNNGGTCINAINDYTCECLPGYTDKNCSTNIDECLPHPCENGGTCIDAINDYTCECLPGYTDKNCSTDIDECRSGPCYNGGTCINAINDYTCECLPGYTDKNCSTNIDECLPHPCENGGTCIDAINDYTCECLPGYTDKNCSTDIDECRSGPCNNGGTCINAINDYTCECLPGYTDKNCSTNIDECLPHPCENGGTCIDAINDYTCECLPGYTDKNCSTADVQFVCYPNETIDVYYLPPRANCYAMQNTTLGADIQCNITRVNERTVRMTECSKDLPILLSYGMYNHMERYQVHAGDSLTVVTIVCSEIPEVGVNHSISNSLAARLELDGELSYDTTYVITSSLNTTSAVVGDPVAWTISFPVEYILEVTNCTAFPESSDPSSLFIPLISNGGCNMDEILISDFVDNMDGNATAVIKAFKFYGVESVYLQCIVTVCPNDTTECNTACSREKRSVKEKRSEEAGSRSLKSSIQSILYVVDGSSSAQTITFPALVGFQIVWNVLLLTVIKLYSI